MTFLQAAATGSRVTTRSLIGVRRMATRGGSAQTITTTGTRWILSARCLGGRRSTADPSDGTTQSKQRLVELDIAPPPRDLPASAMLPPTAAYLAQLIVSSGDSVNSLIGLLASPHLLAAAFAQLPDDGWRGLQLDGAGEALPWYDRDRIPHRI